LESFIQEVIDDSETTTPKGTSVRKCVIVAAGVGTKKNKEKWLKNQHSWLRDL